MKTTARILTEYRLGKTHLNRLSSCRISLTENGTGRWWLSINGVGSLSDNDTLPSGMVVKAIDEIIEELKEAQRIVRGEANR